MKRKSFPKKLLTTISTITLSLSLLSTSLFITPVFASEESPNISQSQSLLNSQAKNPLKVSKITLTKKTTILNTGLTETLIPTIIPDTATDKSVTWKSSKTSVATISQDGKVEAISPGTATITVTTIDGKKKATCKVIVPVNVEDVSLSKSITTIKLGSKQSLKARIYPSKATNKSITWSSSNPSVATVDAKGKILGVNLGDTAITATTADGNKVATCELSVGIPVTKVALNKKNTTINEKENETLIATVIPINATNQDVIWESSDDSIATVDSNGKVSGIKGGTVTVTAITQDGSKIAKCKVTVTTGNYPVIFNDANLEKAVRNSIKKPYGDLYNSDVQKIANLNLEVVNLVDITGVETLINLETLGLGNNKIVDISAIKDLTKLERLFLWNNKITDISAVSGLTKMESLDLGQNQIIDISSISGLTDLSRICFSENQINDISALKELTKLNRIDFRKNMIEDISSLKKLTKLTNIELSNNQIKTVSGLDDLSKLEYLFLGSNQITNTNGFKGLVKLKSLNLANNQISDVSGLFELDNLEYLNLYGNQISEADKGTLENALPDCKISY